MYSLRTWCDDGNEWQRTDVERRSNEGQMKVERTFDKMARRQGDRVQNGRATRRRAVGRKTNESPTNVGQKVNETSTDVAQKVDESLTNVERKTDKRQTKAQRKFDEKSTG